MTEIRFYHMERQNLEQVLPALLIKALGNSHRILIKTSDEKEAERLNEHLWTFEADVFLPHGSQKDGKPDQQPIWLTASNENLNNADVLILTQGTTSNEVSSYKLCCEMLDGRNQTQITEGRSRWKQYKDDGHSLTYWQQGEKGWEKKSV